MQENKGKTLKVRAMGYLIDDAMFAGVSPTDRHRNGPFRNVK